MTEAPAPKTSKASRISIAQFMQPEHANNLGNVHGGWIMKLADEAGAIACMRHAHPISYCWTSTCTAHTPSSVEFMS